MFQFARMPPQKHTKSVTADARLHGSASIGSPIIRQLPDFFAKPESHHWTSGLLAPEFRYEKDQNGKDLHTAQQHGEGAHPGFVVGKTCIVIGGANLA